MTGKGGPIWTRPAAVLACASLLLHLLANGNDGFFSR